MVLLCDIHVLLFSLAAQPAEGGAEEPVGSAEGEQVAAGDSKAVAVDNEGQPVVNLDESAQGQGITDKFKIVDLIICNWMRYSKN